MIGILLDILYSAGLLLSSPVWLYKMARHGRYRTGWGERFGAAPVRYGLQPIIWVHGVSLGEINAARTLVKELHSQLPDYRVVISTTTDTGMAAATKLFAPDHLVFRWPLDFTWAVRRALLRLRPDLVILMEGEVWPNFLAACGKRGIPAVIVNARMSPRGARWKKLGSIAARLFNRLAAVGVQDAQYAQRYIDMGVDHAKVHVTGMLKYDTAEVASTLPGQDELAKTMGIGEGSQLIVAGGTGPGEEKMILDIFPDLARSHPAARLAIVPRKPERFDEVARLIAASGFAAVRRSQKKDGAEGPVDSTAVILGDTMGELRKFYSLAAAVFVGRTLVPMGGSDMIE